MFCFFDDNIANLTTKLMRSYSRPTKNYAEIILKCAQQHIFIKWFGFQVSNLFCSFIKFVFAEHFLCLKFFDGWTKYVHDSKWRILIDKSESFEILFFRCHILRCIKSCFITLMMKPKHWFHFSQIFSVLSSSIQYIYNTLYHRHSIELEWTQL